MHYTLTLTTGRKYSFFEIGCAKIYQNAYGGVITRINSA